MFVSVTTISGRGEEAAETARMAGEAMVSWLREFDGYRGLLISADAEQGRVLVMTFWETREDAERSARGRAQVRDSMVAAAGAQVERVDLLEIVLEDRVP